MTAAGIEPWRSSGRLSSPRPPPPVAFFQIRKHSLIWKTTSRIREVDGDMVGGSTRDCFRRRAAAALRLPSPTPPAVGTNPMSLRSSELYPSYNPSGFGRQGAAVTSFQHRSHRPELRSSLATRPSSAHGGEDLVCSLPPLRRGESASAALPVVAGLARRRVSRLAPPPTPPPGGRKAEAPLCGA